MAISGFRPKAPSMRSSTAMAWLSAAAGRATAHAARCSPLWCADFKGEFKLGNGRYCYPLTVTDHASRFLLLCEALDSTREELRPAQPSPTRSQCIDSGLAWL